MTLYAVLRLNAPNKYHIAPMRQRGKYTNQSLCGRWRIWRRRGWSPLEEDIKTQGEVAFCKVCLRAYRRMEAEQ